MKRSTLFTFCVWACSTAAAAQLQEQPGGADIPFADALDASAVSVPSLESILEHALILGNGDINALLHERDGNLILRITKNDVWDARLETENDPPLPTLSRLKELAAGGWTDRNHILPEGYTVGGPDSYHTSAHPCPRACAVVSLGAGPPAQPSWKRIRSQGKTNTWTQSGQAAVMAVEGEPGASNGYQHGFRQVFSTDDYSRLKVMLSGSKNARYYVDVMDPSGSVILGSGWIDAPTESAPQTFDLPPGKEVHSVTLYTRTKDGKLAENRFESVVFAGKGDPRTVDLNLPEKRPSSPAGLDIRRGVAHVTGVDGGAPAAKIRALMQGNAFLLESSAGAYLQPIQSADLPPASTGETEGVAWTHQVIPGDLDWPGMSFAVALAVEGNRKAVSVVTSRESEDVVADAVKLAHEVVVANPASLIEEHEARWQRFWSASGIEVEDPLLSRAWYRNLFFLRCVTKPGVISPGLFAGLIDDTPAWHGDYHTNYNIQQTFWSSYVTNHPELAEPYDRLISEYLPRARWLARQVFDCDGAYYPHVIFAYEPPYPEKCRSRNGRQYIHHVWGMTLGVAGFTVQPLWWRYQYQPSRSYLEKVAYPAVHDVAVFYADFMDRCTRSQNGAVLLAPSVSPEHWGWTPNFQRNRNCAFDLGMVRYIFRAAIEGAKTLDRDDDLVKRFQECLRRLPEYPTTNDAPAVVVDVEDAPPMTYNIAVPATPVFPCDVVTWWSPAEQKELFARTIDGLQWNGNNAEMMLAVSRARLSMPDTLGWLREEVTHRLRPNGTLTLNRHGAVFNAFGHYTEQFGVCQAVSELLLQSVGDIIRVFPAWPREKAARFRNLRAQGGFLVSASHNRGRVEQLEIVATAAGRLRLLSPWPTIRVQRSGSELAVDLQPDQQGIIQLDTVSGERLAFCDAELPIEESP